MSTTYECPNCHENNDNGGKCPKCGEQMQPVPAPECEKE